MDEGGDKPLEWVASSRKDLCAFPEDARKEAGHALRLAQKGMKHESAKPLKGFGGANVLEIVLDSGGDAYRVVYTVRFPKAVYALHAFQKKSRRKGETPKGEIELLQRRLNAAREHYEENYE